MKIDVSYDAMLQALVEAVRDERDHGAAVMSLVSRLVEEARQQDWFEAHWRTDARLRLAQMACGQMPRAWRSPAPVLEVIAEAARSALKADEVDNESRAILLAIMRLAGVEHSAKSVTKPEPRPALKHPRRRKANGAGLVRRGRTAAQLAKLPAPSQAMAKAHPAAAKSTPVRKAKRSKPVSRSHAPAQPAKPLAPAHAAPIAKASLPAKSAPVRKPNGAGQASTKLGAPAIVT